MYFLLNSFNISSKSVKINIKLFTLLSNVLSKTITSFLILFSRQHLYTNYIVVSNFDL